MDNFTSVTKAPDINQALFQVTHGLYILTSKDGERLNGQCLDALMQVTNQPPRIAIGVGKQHLTHEMIERSGVFAVNVIDKEDPNWHDCVKHYGFQSGRKVDKFAKVKYGLGELGVPLLPEAKAYYECRLIREKTMDLGTHTLFVADVIGAGVSDRGEPLTYNEYRKLVKKG